MFDSWDKTEAALRAVNKLFFLLHENKPAKGSVEEKSWEQELIEVRKWTIQIHERRIALNVKKQNDSKISP